MLKDRQGTTFPGWKGPDSLGQPLKMDPSVPALQDWYRGYLAALLDEYGKDIDGFVWDETFYIPLGFVSYSMTTPAYADRRNDEPDVGADTNGPATRPRRTRTWSSLLRIAVKRATLWSLTARTRTLGAYRKPGVQACLPTTAIASGVVTGLPSAAQATTRLPRCGSACRKGCRTATETTAGRTTCRVKLLDQVLQRFTKNVESGRVRARSLNDLDGS